MNRQRRIPKANRSAEFCITVEPGGTSVYANRSALRTLTDWFAWLAASDPREHFEIHMRWELGGAWRRQKPSWVLFHKAMRGSFRKPEQFELTFMAVEPKDLVKLRQHEKRGRRTASRVGRV